MFIPKSPDPAADGVSHAGIQRSSSGCHPHPSWIHHQMGQSHCSQNLSFPDCSVRQMAGLCGGLKVVWGGPGVEHRTGWLRDRLHTGGLTNTQQEGCWPGCPPGTPLAHGFPSPAGMPSAPQCLPVRTQPQRLTPPSALAGHLAVGPTLLLRVHAKPLRQVGSISLLPQPGLTGTP